MATVSRRYLLERLGVAVGALTAGLATRRAASQQKVSKAEAKYQDSPKGVQRCEICVNFQPPDQCQIVQGTIGKTGWCQFFTGREGAH